MNFKHLYYFWRVARSGGVIRASEELHITPQTISGQIQLLEEELGIELFARQGRSLSLTDAGKLALEYAEEIFSLGAELEETVRSRPDGRPLDFRVGIADVIPKALAYRLLEPSMQIGEPVRLVCREWKLNSLLSELAVHRLDLVISDAPIPPSVNIRGYSHRLGDSGITFFAAPQLKLPEGAPFPQCLDGAPLLCPGEDSALRGKMLRWLDKNRVKPVIIGEFDDSALMNAFGQAGKGAFAATSVLEQEVATQYGVNILGRTREVREEIFAITVERRITHPCTRAITEAAREGLFS